MGYWLSAEQAEVLISELKTRFRIYAPARFSGGATFSDQDCIRYREIDHLGEIEFQKKSDYSFKEILIPLCQTLLYFTEEKVSEPEAPILDAVVFLRSCDLHAVKRLDEIYLHNGPADSYYEKLRGHVRFVLMGCREAFESCFCVDMGTNRSENYDFSMEPAENGFAVDSRDEKLNAILDRLGARKETVVPSAVTETRTHVHIPENLSAEVRRSKMWDEYDTRCIACGRCNFVCPTCTCFTMQDLFYSENGRVGERRRVQASCMVDGFTDVAGGASYRKKNGERMRFKVLHKVLDFKQRFGYQMCVGCGRCDDVCPEYISFSNCLNKLDDAMKEVSGDGK